MIAEWKEGDIEILEPRVAFDANQPRDEAGRWTDGAAQTASPEFKAWFGDSKAVNADGSPKVLYHATKKGFDEFLPVRTGHNSNGFGSWRVERHGIFFAETPEGSETFIEDARGGFAKKGRVMPVYLQASNPLDLSEGVPDDVVDALEAQGMNRGWLTEHLGEWDAFDDDDGAYFVAAVKAAGYDSVKISENHGTSWVVFKPEQIKSAIGNRGTFDPKSKIITASSMAVSALVSKALDATAKRFHVELEPVMGELLADAALVAWKRVPGSALLDSRMRLMPWFRFRASQMRTAAASRSSSASVGFTSRYDVFGPPNGCDGDCEGTGWIPVQEGDETYAALWDAAEAKSPTDDGWHFVPCPACAGRLRAASRERLRAAFDPNQPRDDQGQWTDGGGAAPIPSGLQGLAAEARKASSFEEFEKDFSLSIKHGTYWHITSDPDFQIDATKGPRDMSSMAGGQMTAGKLMVTSHLDYWLEEYPNRPYVALVDMADVPRNAYRQVNRGFGNEFFVEDPASARVTKVYSRAQAKRIDAQRQRQLPQSREALEAFYNRVKGLRTAYDENQPRDEEGKWTDTGAAGAPDTGPKVTLYRGDAKKLQHSLSYSDPNALFGPGIYLTDSKRIAGDYTSKGAANEFTFTGKNATKAEAIERYKRLSAQFIDTDGTPMSFARSLPAYDKDPERIARLAHADRQWEKEKDDFDIRKQADGSIVFRHRENLGHLSSFDIPETWVKKTLDAEREITPRVADALGARVRKDEDGFYPSVREVWRQESPDWTEEKHIEVRKALKSLGYKGIRYSGGVTMGGGHRHNAYVFWDEQGLKKLRTAVVSAEALEIWRMDEPRTLAEHKGLLVGLWLDYETAERVEVPGGEPAADMHITLAYCGVAKEKTVRELTRARQELAAVVAESSALTGTITGTGQFEPSEYSDGLVPVFATVEVDGLLAFRQRIVQALKDARVPPNDNFDGYVPHITLTYVEEGETVPTPDIAGVPLVFRGITIAKGDFREYLPFPVEVAARAAFDANQPRDERGWWTDGTSSREEDGKRISDAQKVLREALIAVENKTAEYEARRIVLRDEFFANPSNNPAEFGGVLDNDSALQTLLKDRALLTGARILAETKYDEALSIFRVNTVGRRATAAAEMSFDPALIDVVDKPPTPFVVGNLQFEEAGHFRPSTGRIEINARNSGGLEMRNTTEIVVHEIAHAQFDAIEKLREQEDEEIRSHPEWHHPEIGNVLDEMKPALRLKYPAQALWGEVMGVGPLADDYKYDGSVSKYDQMVAEDGVSAYSRAYWTKAAVQQRGSYKTAMNETLSEVRRILMHPNNSTRAGDTVPSENWKKLALGIGELYAKRFGKKRT